MSYRPYPDRERALSQLDRHYPALPPSDLQLRFRAALQGAREATQPLAAGVRQLSINAPVLLEQASPAAHRFVTALKKAAAAS